MEVVAGKSLILFGGVLGDLGHGVIKARFLLRVVYFDNVGKRFLYFLLALFRKLDFLGLYCFLRNHRFYLGEAGLGGSLQGCSDGVELFG